MLGAVINPLYKAVDNLRKLKLIYFIAFNAYYNAIYEKF